MKYLLDTHILLWALADSEYLPDMARKIIQDRNNEIYYSLASNWEVEIKHLKFPERFTLTSKQLSNLCNISDYKKLHIKENHIESITLIDSCVVGDKDIHKDPFDKLLFAQAIADNLIFITHDKLFSIYKSQNLLIV